MTLRIKTVSAVVLLALAGGCRSLQGDQFRIAPSPATAGADEAAVRQIVSAEAVRLEPQVQPPSQPRYADSFIEARNFDPLGLGQVGLVARKIDAGIAVDITLWNPHDYATSAALFDEVRRGVAAKLHEEFGDRVQEATGRSAAPLVERPRGPVPPAQPEAPATPGYSDPR
jgi:hypothetical protein